MSAKISHDVVLNDGRRTELMVSTIFGIEKVKRSAVIFGLKAPQKLSDCCGTGSLMGLGYRVVVYTYCSFIVSSKMLQEVLNAVKPIYLKDLL